MFSVHRCCWNNSISQPSSHHSLSTFVVGRTVYHSRSHSDLCPPLLLEQQYITAVLTAISVHLCCWNNSISQPSSQRSLSTSVVGTTVYHSRPHSDLCPPLLLEQQYITAVLTAISVHLCCWNNGISQPSSQRSLSTSVVGTTVYHSRSHSDLCPPLLLEQQYITAVLTAISVHLCCWNNSISQPSSQRSLSTSVVGTTVYHSRPHSDLCPPLLLEQQYITAVLTAISVHLCCWNNSISQPSSQRSLSTSVVGTTVYHSRPHSDLCPPLLLEQQYITAVLTAISVHLCCWNNSISQPFSQRSLSTSVVGITVYHSRPHSVLCPPLLEKQYITAVLTAFSVHLCCRNNSISQPSSQRSLSTFVVQ